MKLLPWILLAMFVAVTIWQWPKPVKDSSAGIRRERDSILHMLLTQQDCTAVFRGEKIVAEEKFALQSKDYEELKYKYDEIRKTYRLLPAGESIKFLKSWTRDSVPG